MARWYARAATAVGVLGAATTSVWLLAPASLASHSTGAVPTSPRTGAVPALSRTSAPGAPWLRSAPAKNPNFAGYRRNGGGSLASFDIKATFVAPRITGCTAASRAIAPDIDVSNGTTRGHSGVGLFVGCYKGNPDYFPFILLNGSNTDYAAGTVQPGDSIKLHLAEGPHAASISFQDITHHVVKIKRGSGLKGLGFPGIGDNSWLINNVELGVPNFGRVVFSHCVVNGAALGAGGSPGSPAVLEYDRATKAGTVQIATGGLTAGKQAFTTYFKHS